MEKNSLLAKIDKALREAEYSFRVDGWCYAVIILFCWGTVFCGGVAVGKDPSNNTFALVAMIVSWVMVVVISVESFLRYRKRKRGKL